MLLYLPHWEPSQKQHAISEEFVAPLGAPVLQCEVGKKGGSLGLWDVCVCVCVCVMSERCDAF